MGHTYYLDEQQVLCPEENPQLLQFLCSLPEEYSMVVHFCAVGKVETDGSSCGTAP